MRGALLGAWVLATCALASPRAPTSAALRRTFETSRRSIVEVVGPRRTGLGVIIGADGQVLTSVEFVGLEQAQVRHAGALLPAHVRAANARLQIAVVEVEASAQLPSVAVRLDPVLGPGAWLVGVESAKKGELKPVLAQVRRAARAGPPSVNGEAPSALVGAGTPFIELDVLLAPGSPLFDTTGKLVAIAVGQGGKRGRRALPVPEVKSELARSEAP